MLQNLIKDERRRWAVLVVVCFGQLMIVLDTTIVNVAIPQLSDGLNAQLSEGGLEAELSSLLTAGEVEATKIRVETLLKHRVHPYPPADWPAVPWPPV